MKKIILFSMALSLSACVVSKKKYDAALAQKISTESQLHDKTTRLEKTTAELQTATVGLARLRKDSADLMNEYGVTEKKLNDTQKNYNQLNDSYKSLLTNSGQLNRDLTAQKNQLLAIQQNLTQTRIANDSLHANLQQREKKVKELETILATESKSLGDLKNLISNALLSFKESDLTITKKNGKVYISLAEQLLFGSGSVEIDAKGVSALQQVARALKDKKDIEIMIEGHTDNVPISKPTQYMHDNRDLSVLRATSITRILVNEGVSPVQIIAAGRGEYLPLVENSSPQNKRINRRTEIIISPNLKNLYDVIDTQ